MTDSKREWIQSEPGILALKDTSFRIVYEPATDGGGDFVLCQGDRRISRHRSLDDAKAGATNRQSDLEEIGAAY